MNGNLASLLSGKLKMSKITHPDGIAYLRYDDSFDALTLMLVAPSDSCETVVHYVDSHIGLLYDPETFEVVGFQIEAFEKSFVPQHANVGKVWKLSGDDLRSKDFGELTIRIDALKPKIVKEVMAASRDAFQRFGLPAFSPSLESRQFAVV
jgi:hypothetical protein